MINRERAGHVEVVRLDRPPLNLLGRELIGELHATFAAIGEDPPRVVVLFCGGGGADVRELVELDPRAAREFITALHEACFAIRMVDAPVMAVIEGPCLGAHLEVAAACDLRVASSGARLGMPEVKVGIPSVIDAFWLMTICGLGEAARLVFDGEVVDAAEARRMGLVNDIAPDVEQDALAWAERIAAASPRALAQQKRVVRDWTDAPYREAVRTSIEHFSRTFEFPEVYEAMRAFLEKRRPSFS